MSGRRTCPECGIEFLSSNPDSVLCGLCMEAEDALRARMAGLVRVDRAREAIDLDALRAERDRLRPVPLPGEDESTGPRLVTYWAGDNRLGALRTMIVPGPVRTDNWGKPIR